MRICVYGAASNNIDESYKKAVEKLGRELAKRGHSLVYGAGANGLMGAVARGVCEEKGKIVGVIPSFFNVDGVLFPHCTEMIKTKTMRERKQIMEDNADAFIMVPGGIGTYDEFFEILTLKQLKQHEKPVAIFNVNNYYDEMDKMMQKAVKEGFVSKPTIYLYEIIDDIDKIFEYIENYQSIDFEVSDIRNAGDSK